MSATTLNEEPSTGPILLQKLRSQRRQIGLTQEDLARLSGLTARTIQRIEAGHVTSLDAAKSISAAMDLPSYHQLIEPPAQVDAEPTKRALKEQIDVVVQLILAKRSPILISISALVLLLLMNPFGFASTAVAAALCIMLPWVTVACLATDTSPGSGHVGVWTGIAMAITVGISVPAAAIFAAFSFAHTKDLLSTQSGAMLSVQNNGDLANVATAMSEMAQMAYLTWVGAGLTLMICLLLTHLIIHRNRRAGVHFGQFGFAMLFTAMVSKVFGLLHETTFVVGTSLARLPEFSLGSVFDVVSLIVYVMTYVGIACVSYVILKSEDKCSKDEETTLCIGIASGMLALFVGSLIAYFAQSEIAGFVEKQIAALLL